MGKMKGKGSETKGKIEKINLGQRTGAKRNTIYTEIKVKQNTCTVKGKAEKNEKENGKLMGKMILNSSKIRMI
jgi:hypothetical protein